MHFIVQLTILGIIIFFISSKLLRQNQNLKLNEPPLIPYKYPIIGHTFDYYRNTEKFINKCREEYGETFSLYVFGKVVTFVGSDLAPEVFKGHKDFDLQIALKEKFPIERFLNRPDSYLAPMSKLILTHLSDLPLYTERIQKTLIEAIDEFIGDGKVLQPPLRTFQLIIAKPITAALIGEEFSDDKELVHSVAFAASDFIPFIAIPPFLSFIHPLLHKEFLILLFKIKNNPFKTHREVIKRKISPVVERRLNDMKKLGQAYVPSVDLLQKYIEFLHNDYTIDLDILTDYVIATLFAAVHTTSNFITNALHQYANYPQFQKELVEEQEQLLKSKNGKTYYTFKQIDGLVKLDSFFKETLRLTTSIVHFEHMVLNSHYTFSNGYQVPKDRFVFVRLQEVHRDEKLQGENPNEFNSFRHIGTPALRAEKNFLAFGLGRHACPGRYFAANEIKTALHYLFLNYNIKNLNGKKVDPKIRGPMRFSSDEGLVFEKKK